MLICQITDLHIKAAGRKSYRVVDTTSSLRACVASIQSLPQRPDVILATGDLTDFGRPDEYAALAELLAPLSQPVYFIPGNHDDRDALRAAFPAHRYLGAPGPSVHYVIDDYPLRLIGLDTVVPRASYGKVDDASLEWLDDTLSTAPNRPTVVLMHHPPFDTGIGHMDEIGLTNGAAFHAVVKRHPQIERILCGHLHRSIIARFAGTVASTCPSPAHQVMLDLDRDAPSQFMMEPPGFQLHLWLPDTGLVSHTAAIGAYPGPYPFFDEDGLID